MKKTFILSVLILLTQFYISCKSDQKQIENVETNDSNPVFNENLEQPPLVLQNKEGIKMEITFFAKEDEVAVKILMDEQIWILDSKGLNDKGNPIFSTQDFMWELFPDMKSGQLTDESGNSSVFFQVIN